MRDDKIEACNKGAKMNKIIEDEHKKFKEKESFIVNTCNEGEEEYFGFKNAVDGLQQEWINYEASNGASFSSNMVEPSLFHPDGSGLEWAFYEDKWW